MALWRYLNNSVMTNLKDWSETMWQMVPSTTLECTGILFQIWQFIRKYITHGCPHHPKVPCAPRHFYERPTLVPILTDWKKSGGVCTLWSSTPSSLPAMPAHERFRRNALPSDGRNLYLMWVLEKQLHEESDHFSARTRGPGPRRPPSSRWPICTQNAVKLQKLGPARFLEVHADPDAGFQQTSVPVHFYASSNSCCSNFLPVQNDCEVLTYSTGQLWEGQTREARGHTQKPRFSPHWSESDTSWAKRGGEGGVRWAKL